ncbi:MAG: hypothetical protein NTW86_15515 [Candidatus Sumerlaeota bacterium]|nr:hypothetical protein [Candidatus Sumerlaeota bacterium]
MALTLTRRGNSLLSDDLGVVRCVEGVPVVMPAFPIIRMWPDVILSLGGEPEALPRVRSNHDKRSERFRAGFSPSPVPLSRLYVLEYGEALEIEPILPRDALKEMIRHLYVAPYGLDLLRVIGLGTVFDKFGALAARVPVFRLRRPRDLGALPEIARAVEEHMGREF